MATHELTRKILDMSSGVFLWVKLVVQSLLDGLTNYDSLSDLHTRLLELPPELHDLYHLMVRSISPPFYMVQASRVLQIVVQAVKPLSVLLLSFADEEDIHLAARASVGGLLIEESELREKSITAKINSRCRGLLEVRKSAIPGYGAWQEEVHFLHLTVKEFLERPEIWKDLRAQTANTTFNPHASLMSASLFALKKLQSQDNMGVGEGENLICIEELMEYAFAAENSVGTPQVALMDSIDKTAAQLWAERPSYRAKQKLFSRLRQERRPHWTEMAQLQVGVSLPVTSFVAYAILKGLTLDV